MAKVKEEFWNQYWLNDDEPWNVYFYMTERGYLYQATKDRTKRISEAEYQSAIEYHYNA